MASLGGVSFPIAEYLSQDDTQALGLCVVGFLKRLGMYEDQSSPMLLGAAEDLPTQPPCGS